jgi:hypothetical protein
LGGSLAELRSELATQAQDTRSLREQVAALREKPERVPPGQAPSEELGAKLTALEGALGVVEGVPEALEEHSGALTELTTRLASLEQGLNEVQRTQADGRKAQPRAQAPEAPPPPVKLPFRLAAIDSWNGELYAALSMRGQIDLVQAGERYSGWTVEAIDGARREVLFARDGRRVTRRAPD